MIQAPIGTKDVTPEESYQWHYVERIIREVTANFGYGEVRTPVFEHTELFLRGVGETTDVVQKEMYTFQDKGDRSITLKPEGTAGAVRAYIEHALNNLPQPIRMYYMTPVFRYERPQAGRFREHHQFGVEVFGARSAMMDAEVISVALTVLTRLGIGGLKLNINSIGCADCRPSYNEKLIGYLREHSAALCPTCRERLDRNPLRVLDCKNEACKAIVAKAPIILDSLCGDCATHFQELQDSLKALGIEYRINPLIVRGLDYYTNTVFEIISDALGSQSTVCGGGRYDTLVEQLGGAPTPGLGFGMGMERALIIMQNQGVTIPQPPVNEVFIASIGDAALKESFALSAELRQAGIKATCEYTGRSLKAQMKYANKLGSAFVILIGEDELQSGVYKLKDMKNGTEQSVARNEIKNVIGGEQNG